MDHRYCKAQQYITWTHTVKPFNLATIKVGDFECKFISAPFILANSNHTISRRHTMPIKVGILSIFAPFNFYVFV